MNKILLVLLAAGLSACSSGENYRLSQNQNFNGIFGGEAVSADDVIAKSTVAILDVYKGDACTATLVTKNIVVTAAHCVQSGKDRLRVLFGLDLDTAKQVAVREAKANDKYAQSMSDIQKILQKITDTTIPGDDRDQQMLKAMDEYKNWGDVGLVKFEGDAPDGYEPAQVLDDAHYIQNGMTVTIAGYGLTKPYSEQSPDKPESSILRKVDVQVTDAAFSETEVSFDQSNGKGACHGDSGGPAYVKVGDDLKLFAVTSRGLNDPSDTCRASSAYTYLPAWKQWLDDSIAEMSKAASNN